MADEYTEENGYTIVKGVHPRHMYAYRMRKTLERIVKTFSNERTLDIYVMWLEGKTIRGIARRLKVCPATVRYHMAKVKVIFPNLKPWI